MKQALEVFTQDQIQLIGIEARVFDDLADLESERQCRVVRSQEKGLRPTGASTYTDQESSLQREKVPGVLFMTLLTAF